MDSARVRPFETFTMALLALYWSRIPTVEINNGNSCSAGELAPTPSRRRHIRVV